MSLAKTQLSRLALPSKSIEPGEYRVYLTPTALDEIISMISWGGFGLQSHEAKVSPLLKLALGEREPVLKSDSLVKPQHSERPQLFKAMVSCALRVLTSSSLDGSVLI